jgi:RNA polymerase sigma-70 factor (ECF subfamily)
MEDTEAAMMRVLYAEHAAALWRYALRLTGDQAAAEDVVQETLLRAWRRRPEGVAVGGHPDTGERSPRAWLFTVARNLVIDDRRSARYRNEAGTPDLDRVADRAGPDEASATLDRMTLQAALAALSDEHRAVIRRSYYEGAATGQIAQELQIPEGTVKSRLHYAVRALRLNLHEMGVTR